MRVVYFSHDDGKYGAPKSLMDLLEVLIRRDDFTPIVVTSKSNEFNEWCNNKGIENYSIPYSDCMYGYEKKRAILRKIHSVYIHGIIRMKHDLFNQFFITKIEGLIDFKNVDIIHSNVSIIDIGAIISKHYSIPHVWHIREYGMSSEYAYIPFRRNFCKYIEKNSSVALCISEYVKDNWVKMGLNPECIKVEYDAVKSPELIEYELKKHDKVRIIFSGSSTPAKGLIDLLKAIEILHKKNINNYVLYVYGDYSNDYGQKLIEWVKNHKIDNVVQFQEFDEQLKNKISRFDIGVVTSRSEAFGRVTVEYMMAGLCLIASNTGANPELIIDNYSGLVYQYNNPNSLARLLEKVIVNKTLRKSLKLSARKYAEEKFDTKKCADRILQIYYSLMERKI
ncbi:hypothetical protein AXY43_20175 [Clostridium sp. MF28]|uniref:glycosyltransferase family 4 protein n=1 Tax=Clostridium TaxID=1485 RepID=UPI000CFA7096|nr:MULTISPECIES: glycosyltransferase family 4 protein [Clostridium]AVK50119.1 hypothetical protein AXY43_20175 [Clostridium sp. MF28]PSM57645.1 hypothetical protein C4L39_11700 [Clostridium diolis]